MFMLVSESSMCIGMIYERSHLNNAFSVGIDEILEDLLDSYRYVQGQLAKDLNSVGVSIRIDAARCSAHGWSAGGSSVVYLVSIPCLVLAECVFATRASTKWRTDD
jgi:hypothetical protein